MHLKQICEEKTLISLCCQCTKYTKEHNALFFFGNNIVHFWMQGTQCTALLYAYKKEGHMAFRHFLGFDNSLCFNWMGSSSGTN